MKSNAIVRIVIWSVVILVLLAVLIAGLANNLFTVFRDNTDVIHHDSLEVSQSVLVMSETNIYEMPNDQSKVKGTLAAGDAFGGIQQGKLGLHHLPGYRLDPRRVRRPGHGQPHRFDGFRERGHRPGNQHRMDFRFRHRRAG